MLLLVSDVHLSSGPPETVLEDDPDDAQRALERALAAGPGGRREAVRDMVARWPSSLDGWARLGDLARDEVEAYACFRVGYHRGLDRLRQEGWRGSGYVRWRHPSNRGFLRALDGLRAAAAAIGESAEAERCAMFLRQLDPDWSGSDLSLELGASAAGGRQEPRPSRS